MVYRNVLESTRIFYCVPDKIFSNQHSGMRVYMKLVMIMGSEHWTLPHQNSNCQQYSVPK